MSQIADTLKRHHALLCLECGKCTAVCPIARVNNSYSPRTTVAHSLERSEEAVLEDPMLWACLNCKNCEPGCPADVDYNEITRDLRTRANEHGQRGHCTHGGALQALMRIMTTPELKQKRLNWVTDDLRISDSGETLYFVGCAPYFDLFFAKLGTRTLEAAKSVIRILNKLDIAPALMSDERCCGHDLLWSGDQTNFLKLAEHNLQAVAETGAKRVVFSCPECYRTVKDDYARYFGRLDFETQHISEIIAEQVDSGRLFFPTNSRDHKVTYQDPCRLGRHLGVYDAPRKVMNSVPGVKLGEMGKHGKRAVCCGVSNWMNCTTYSKQIQVERLREAKKTGADTLITACPKCEIHLRCAMNDPNLGSEIHLEIKDVATLAAESFG